MNCRLLACNLLVLLLLGLLLLGQAGCDTTTHFHQAKLDGVPRCPNAQVLRHPVCIELNGGDKHHLRQVFTGTDNQPAISLPDERRSWMLRAGECENARELKSPHYQCGDCQIFWEREITTEPDTSKLVVPSPSQFECIGPDSSK